MIRFEKPVVDREGIKYIATAEGAIGGIPVYMIDGRWKMKSIYIDVDKIGELKSMKITKDMIDYINLCFIDFSDEDRYKISNGSSIININISVLDESTLTYNDSSVDGHTKVYKWRLEQLEQIESCLNKIKLEYSDIFYYIEFNEYPGDNGFMRKGDGEINISISKYKSSLKQRKL
jgi:hypothetical protein